MSRRSETATAPPTPRAKRAAGAQRRTSKAGEFEAQRPRGGRLTGPCLLTRKKTCRLGKFFRRRGWRRRLRDLAVIETCRDELAGPERKPARGRSTQSVHLDGGRRRTLPPGPSQPCLAASRGRYRHQQPIAQSTTVDVWMEVRWKPIADRYRIGTTPIDTDFRTHSSKKWTGSCRVRRRILCRHSLQRGSISTGVHIARLKTILRSRLAEEPRGICRTRRIAAQLSAEGCSVSSWRGSGNDPNRLAALKSPASECI